MIDRSLGDGPVSSKLLTEPSSSSRLAPILSN